MGIIIRRGKHTEIGSFLNNSLFSDFWRDFRRGSPPHRTDDRVCPAKLICSCSCDYSVSRKGWLLFSFFLFFLGAACAAGATGDLSLFGAFVTFAHC